MADSEPLALFMKTPLVQWIQLILGRESLEPEDLIDGVALNEIMLDIDPRPTNAKADRHARGNVNLSVQNLSLLLKHIKAYYEDIQQQVIVMSLPNVLTLVRELKDPGTEAAITQMQKLLLLVLGCAVQCEHKEKFIEKMKQLTYSGMETMMNHIKDITENTDNILSLQWFEQEEQLPPDELDEWSRNVTYQVKRLVAERDEFSMMITGLTQERDYLQSQQGSPNAALTRKDSFMSPASKHHVSVELADVKAKLRKTKQELDDKTEQVNDLKAELEEKDDVMLKLKQENAELANDARSARTYRDENDILKEKATKASRLEHEVERLREKLKDVDFYKQRVDEIRDDNKVLHETKAMLEDQLEVAHSRLDELVDAEKKIVDLKERISQLLEDKDHDQQRIQELEENNVRLELDKSHSMNESGHLAFQLEQARSADGGHKSIHEESNESAQSRVLRLEKENRHLQSLVNSYKVSMSSAQLDEANKVELEKENKRLGNKVQKLQELLNKEKLSYLDYEQMSNNVATEKKNLETMLETVKSNSTRQIDELKSENEQLNKTVETLRKRSKINAEGRAKDIEKENKVLSETVKDVTARIHKIEYEKKQLQHSLEQAKDSVEKADELTKDNAKLEKENINLQKMIAQLKITCEQVESIEQQNSDLDVENRQLKKQIENLKSVTSQLQDLEKDKGLSEQETVKLKRQVESLKKTCEKMAVLEQEKMDAEKALKSFKRKVEAMKQSKEQTEKMEFLQAELENELDRVRSQLDVSQVSKEKEIQELEKENEELQNKLEKLVASYKKLEHYEREYQKVEGENAKLLSENKKARKETQRAKQSFETLSAKFEQMTAELESKDRQNKAMMHEIEKGEESSNRIRELETEMRELKKNQIVEKKTLTTLREELVNEKLLVRQKQSDLDKLSAELELIGLNKEQLLNAENQNDDSRFKALESRFESTFKKTVEAKEEKINSLEARLKESASINMKLKDDIKNIKRDYEALAQRHNEEVDYSKSRSRSSRDYSATTELLKIKDHLIDVERKNATLIAENSSIQTISQDLKHQVTKLQSQNENAIVRQTKLQDEVTNLKTQCAKLQVENSTLDSQATSLLAQNQSVTGQQSAIEVEKRELEKRLDEIKTERDNLEKDHDDLMQLHENQTIEVEGLMQEHQKMKMQNRQLRNEFKDLESKHNGLLRTKDEVERLKRRLESEVEKKVEEGHLVEGNLGALKEAHDKLNSSYKKLSAEYSELQERNRAEKSAHNALKLQYGQLESDLENFRDQNQELDFKSSKLSSRCEVLMQLKTHLEEENRHLLDQIDRLMSQNEDLLSQTLESKDQIYSEQKQYTERMQEIRRQKEKLEEKIMDLYRTPGPSPPKKRGIGATLKKTLQNLGKGSENRRKRDGLPPASSTMRLAGSSPRTPDATSARRGSSGSREFPKPEADNESLGSNSSENQRKQSAVERDLSKDSKRRSRLGVGMAYSTNALHALTSANGAAGDSNQLKASSQQVKKMDSQHDGPTNTTNSTAKGHLSNASSEDTTRTASGDRITLAQFLDENKGKSSKSAHFNVRDTGHFQGISGNVNLMEKRTPATPPTKPLLTSPMTPTEKWSPQRSAGNSERRSSLNRPFPLKSTPTASDVTDSAPLSSSKRKPPRLDLSSLQNDPPLDMSRRSGPSTGSPSTGRASKKGLDNSPVTPKDMKNGTMVFVVRSPSEGGSPARIQVKQQSGPPVNSNQERSNPPMRPKVDPRARPSSAAMDKPTGNVAPYAHHLHASQSMRELPREDRRSGSAIDRLDSLVSTPRSSTPISKTRQSAQSNGVMSSPSRPRTPTSHRATPNSGYAALSLPRQHRTPRSPHATNLTSTPDPTRQIDVATVNPLQASSNPTRRDVPPDVVPSPIRRDVPPDANSMRRTPNHSAQSLHSTPSGARRSLTPNKPKPDENSTESDKSTLWFEYGCV